MNRKRKIFSILLSAISCVIIVYLLVSPGGQTKTSSNVSMRDGIQYITIDARGGYKPETTLAKGGIPTKLIMNTKNTYDCSAAVVVPSVNYREILPENAMTEIDLGTPQTGEKIPGNCSMGMYHFSLIFE